MLRRCERATIFSATDVSSRWLFFNRKSFVLHQRSLATNRKQRSSVACVKPTCNRTSFRIWVIDSFKTYSGQLHRTCSKPFLEVIPNFVGLSCVRHASAYIVSILVACTLLLTSPSPVPALPAELHSTDVSKERYERAIKSHSRSNLPSKGEAEMLLQLNQDLFTDDAWEGMKT